MEFICHTPLSISVSLHQVMPPSDSYFNSKRVYDYMARYTCGALEREQPKLGLCTMLYSNDPSWSKIPGI